jgi:hypothetical protein
MILNDFKPLFLAEQLEAVKTGQIEANTYDRVCVMTNMVCLKWGNYDLEILAKASERLTLLSKAGLHASHGAALTAMLRSAKNTGRILDYETVKISTTTNTLQIFTIEQSQLWIDTAYEMDWLQEATLLLFAGLRLDEIKLPSHLTSNTYYANDFPTIPDSFREVKLPPNAVLSLSKIEKRALNGNRYEEFVKNLPFKLHNPGGSFGPNLRDGSARNTAVAYFFKTVAKTTPVLAEHYFGFDCVIPAPLVAADITPEAVGAFYRITPTAQKIDVGNTQSLVWL